MMSKALSLVIWVNQEVSESGNFDAVFSAATGLIYLKEACLTSSLALAYV
jgi:hypothetical protein